MATSFHRNTRCPHSGLKEDSRVKDLLGWASTLSADGCAPDAASSVSERAAPIPSSSISLLDP
jgi:hypothetical protein